MRQVLRLRIPLPALVGLVVGGLLSMSVLPGCGSRPTTDDRKSPSTASGLVKRPPGDSATRTASATGGASASPAGQNPTGATTLAAEERKLQEINGQLEIASKMMKSANLEGALRVIDRVHGEHSRDPNITMQTNYLRAMVFHRMKDGNRRKQAMNDMLKSMEALQKDPRFTQAHEDGTSGAEVIQMSVQKGGDRFDP